MRPYYQLTPGERYELSALRRQGLRPAEIARALGRHRSTVTRELRRNICSDGAYRPATADDFARWRRARSRRNQRFVAKDWALVLSFLKQQWSPEQISGRLKRDGGLRISHESIYRYIWQDKRRGGTRYKLLRQAGKKSRKRYDAYDSRGRLAGKRHISERPAAAQDRTLVGHWEIDTVVGPGRPCIVTLVERVTGYVMIGKLLDHTVAALNRGALRLIDLAPMPVRTVTADNGTEFHGYKDLEAATGALFYFATPHHSWERGTSENTNGLIRQYIPKRTSMSRLSQLDCDRIAHKLNHRPRRRLGFRTPAECYELTSAT
jgi:IS30 family transposase